MKKKILYVEDNKENLQLIARILEAAGYEMVVAEDGVSGIEVAKRERPDLILMDINLPDMDGYAAATLIKSITGLCQTPLVALTANVMKGDRERTLAAGCDGYIPKPIHVKGFVAEVEAYLGGKKDDVEIKEETVYLKEHNLHLVERLEREIAELKRAHADRLYHYERLKERTDELSLLFDTTTLISSSLDLRGILDASVQLVTQKISTAFSRMILFNFSEDRLILKASYAVRTLPWKTDGEVSYPITESLLFNQMKDAWLPLLLKKGDLPPITSEEGSLFTGNLTELQSLLVLPIIRKGARVGLLSLGEIRKWERAPFTSDKIRLCHAVANQMGNAIENATLYEDVVEKSLQLKLANLDSVQALAGALETKDLDTKGHSDRTMAYALAVAKKMGLSEQEQEWGQYAAVLHDIGKIGIPESILKKPGKLTHEEYEVMRRHVTYGGMIVRKIKFLDPIVSSVEADHERWDGNGYPRGLKGEEIPLLGRIVAVVDAYDAMTANRVYRKAPGKAFAIEELRRCAGSQFDPTVVEVFLETLPENGG